MKFFISVFIALLISYSCHAQEDILTIENNLEGRTVDSSLINDYCDVIAYYVRDDSAKTINLLHTAFELSKELEDDFYKAKILVQFGRFHVFWSENLDQTINYYTTALKIFREGNHDKEELLTTRRLSAAYRIRGEKSIALEIYLDALKAHPNDLAFQCTINNAIGGMMKDLEENEKSIHYYTESETNYLLIENPSNDLILMQLSNDKNRGVIYRNIEAYDTAVFYFNRSLEKAIEISDSAWIARNYNSMGIMYSNQEKYDLSIDAYKKSLQIKRSLNYSDGVVTTLNNIGYLYLELGDLKQAQLYLEEAHEICKTGCQPQREGNNSAGLSQLYFEMGRYKEAYLHLSKSNAISDSLDYDENNKLAKELEAQYQNETNQILQQKLKIELEASNLRDEHNSQQIEKQKVYLLLGTIIGVILLSLVVFIIRSNLKRKQVNAELVEKSQKISIQNQQIEEKSQEIHDSITYAKRIQEAILPTDEHFKSNLPDSYIYYEPKDILAGDFYWMDEIDDTIIWAAADCTGHGIPGAMVSVVCHNALNQSVREHGLKDPGQILDNTRQLVIETFEKSIHQVKDGMDIALCCLDKKTNTLHFSGANNPLWLIRNKEQFDQLNEKDLLEEESQLVLREIRGDKQPIGTHYDYKDFKSNSIKLLKNDLLVVFTDGFADQFGGEKGKKLKNKNFKKLILENAALPIPEQLEIVKKSFTKWKGDFEQLDDVCVIAVRL